MMYAIAFEKSKPILDKLISNGFEAYIVGGAVRDYLLGVPFHDIDIVTSATVEEIQSVFKHTAPVGIRHGTVIVVEDGRSFEVTSFRGADQKTLFVDLQHRDFTINAIAMSVTQEVIDPFDGMSDLKKRIIRAVESAQERFREDPLRLLRAIRFVSERSFRMESSTFEAIKTQAHLIQTVALERSTAEFERILQGKHVHEALRLFVKTELYQSLFYTEDKKDQLIQVSRLSLGDLQTIAEYWAAFLVCLEMKQPVRLLKQLKRSNQLVSEVRTIIDTYHAYQRTGWTSLLVYDIGLRLACQTERMIAVMSNREADLKAIEKVFHQLTITDRSQLKVDGNDVITLVNRPPGPWVKQALRDIEIAIVNQELVNDREQILCWIDKGGVT
ncbi:CCA tRNA nucleotidyltransferase [Desertibacillus haloalkaliphilus]|uniref:CCA tRNA nucleotidyltransferase n=1 Tax=Desertibacillus haloalkaliphilus TaxID=1328930 RepID=UPI001C268488|nr:CCA tRNA nucleotidyltransferase [Desertibacillus haloalkaliphilus]